MAEKTGIKSREQMGETFKGRTPLKPYAGESLDIANAYLYLASEESKYVTGLELVVDGGWTTSS